MEFDYHDKKGLQVQIMIIFCVFYLLELIFFSLAIFFDKEEISITIFIQFSGCLTFGNFYLLYGIFTKNASILALYFLIYIYTIVSNFLGASDQYGLYFIFKICQVATTGIRGVSVCFYYTKFVNKFISFYFRKYQSDEKLIGKFIF